jgi:hypothetical protein
MVNAADLAQASFQIRNGVTDLGPVTLHESFAFLRDSRWKNVVGHEE